MNVLCLLKPPGGISEIPEDTVWIHNPPLSKEHQGVNGLAA
jgi:hypothetical protein